MSKAKTRTYPKMTEKQLQKAVIDLAHLRGWKIAHFRTAMNADGSYVTPVAADGKGWPDLVLVRDQRLLFVELKSDGGDLRREQHEWLAALRGAHPSVWVWRPDDWRRGLIASVLK